MFEMQNQHKSKIEGKLFFLHSLGNYNYAENPSHQQHDIIYSNVQ